jgi:hypothetical protein
MREWLGSAHTGRSEADSVVCIVSIPASTVALQSNGFDHGVRPLPTSHIKDTLLRVVFCIIERFRSGRSSEGSTLEQCRLR